MNLISIVRKFPTQQSCIKHLEAVRWPENASCPHCGGIRVHRKKGITEFIKNAVDTAETVLVTDDTKRKSYKPIQ